MIKLKIQFWSFGLQSLLIIIPHFNKGGGFNRKYLYMQGIYFIKKQAL